MYGVPPANKGKACPQHVRDAVSKAQKGRKDSPEIIEKRTRHLKDRNPNAKPIALYHNNEYIGIFNSIKQISEYIGINYNTLKSAIKNAIKNNSEYKGYKFEYV